MKGSEIVFKKNPLDMQKRLKRWQYLGETYLWKSCNSREINKTVDIYPCWRQLSWNIQSGD